MGLLDKIGDVFDKIGPGLPIVGDFISGIQSGKEAERNRDFQKAMSDTAHQREVKDLRAAGLNPILSGTGGAGSSSPSGAVAQVPDYGRGAASALALRQQMKLNEAQIAKLGAETENVDSVTRNNNYDYALKREYAPLEKQASLWEAKTRIRKLLQETSSSAIDQKTKESRLQRELADPELQQWIISEGYASQKQIDRAISGDSDASDIIALLLKIVRGR